MSIQVTCSFIPLDETDRQHIYVLSVLRVMHEQVYAAHGVSAHRFPPDRPLGVVRRGWSVKLRADPLRGALKKVRPGQIHWRAQVPATLVVLRATEVRSGRVVI